MAVSLLQTKLFVPPSRAELIPRPRLMKRLDERRRLTLISAPAGFGKTTLVSAWVEAISAISAPAERVAWLSLDAADDDLTRFWSYIIAALQTAHPNIGETALAMQQTPQPPPVETLLTVLLNEAAALVEPLVLVLDDYHRIEASSIHEAMAFLLDHLPHQMRLILLTRADPPLPLARMRTRDQLTELRAVDLRFTTDEAAAFLNRVMGLDLNADDIAALEACTEGWIAGLQLAALSMQRCENTQGFVSAFTGSHHYIVDYLTEEVLNRQSQAVQAFLLRTAILERLHGPLCDVLTGQSDGQAMLEMLEKANLFLVRLDDERQWYRYHHLLAHSLQNRLQQTEKELVPYLHRQAADWFEQHGLLDQALTHWMQAQDWERAAQLIERRGVEMLALGEMTILRRWIDMLPVELVHRRPWLCIVSAWTLLLGWDLEKSKVWIQSAQECLSSQMSSGQADEIAGHIAAIQAYVAGIERDDRRAYTFCRQALDLLPQNSTFLRGLIAYLFGMINLRAGDLDGAWTAIEEAGRMCQTSGVLHVGILAITALGIVRSLQGRLYLAGERYQEALRLAARGRKRPLPVAAVANNYLAGLMYEWNDLEAADQYLAQGVEQSKLWGSTEDVVNSAVARARICRARGDLDGVRQAIEQMQDTIPTPELRIGQIVTTQIQYWLDRGDLEAAGQLARQSGIGKEGDPNLNSMGEWIALARLRLAQGRLDETARLLARLEAFCQAGLTGPLIEVLRLQALALQAQQQTDQAVVVLRHALLLAEPGGYIRSFVDEGPAVRRLLAELQSQLEQRSVLDAATGRLLPYVRKVLAAFPTSDAAASQPQDLHPQVLVEPLSERELDVLRLLAEGRSNQEIGNALFIAVGTVKKHLSNIFGKLGVQNRTECAARARELSLI